MKAVKLNGEVIEFKTGKKFCGTGFKEVTITFDDVDVDGFLEYLHNTIIARLSPTTGDKNERTV